MHQHEAAHVLIRSARRNFWMNVGDGATFAFGLSMVSRYTVLPLFVSRISSDPLLLGVLPALFSLGWLLPQLFTAPLVASLPRRLPWNAAAPAAVTLQIADASLCWAASAPTLPDARGAG